MQPNGLKRKKYVLREVEKEKVQIKVVLKRENQKFFFYFSSLVKNLKK